MKKHLILLICILTLSCSIEDDTLSFQTEFIPIESVVIPEEFELGTTYEISLNYIKPTNCHNFSDIFYSANNNERTVAIINSVVQNSNCITLETELEATFGFKATEAGSYIFKFWQGKDDSGGDTYLIVEVPVIE
ncbi:hypothetical protein [Lacinutrix sp.]|uniref:hypothetical protein n=1 Tax=Lacinutrix sp. TaxID=1937692 RepID=UPI0025C39FE4|nr:hypothetical protein [Lacinutrix sp.]